MGELDMKYNGKELSKMDEHEFLMTMEALEYNMSKIYEYMESLGFQGKQLTSLFDYWVILRNHTEMARSDIYKEFWKD